MFSQSSRRLIFSISIAGHLSRTQCAKSTRHQWVDRRTCTPVVSSVSNCRLLTRDLCWANRQVPRSRDGCRWAKFDGLYISGAQCALRAQRAHDDGEIRSAPATLHIDSKSIRRISTMCQYKEARSVQPRAALADLTIGSCTEAN